MAEITPLSGRLEWRSWRYRTCKARERRDWHAEVDAELEALIWEPMDDWYDDWRRRIEDGWEWEWWYDHQCDGCDECRDIRKMAFIDPGFYCEGCEDRAEIQWEFDNNVILDLDDPMIHII